MPSTSRTLPISEKFCKDRAFSFGKAQNKIKILSEIPWRRPLFSLSFLMARKRTKSETKSMTTENLLKQRLTWKENLMKRNLAHSADNSQKPKPTG